MVFRLALGMALLVGMATSAMGQSGESQFPHVRLSLPSGIPSESAMIDYFMAGPFGGRGGFLWPEKERQAYDIPAFENGKPADTVKVIAYLPGCKIATLTIEIKGNDLDRAIPCVPLGSSLVWGQIDPALIADGRATYVEVDYLAMWGPNFLGYADGPVPQIRIASGAVDETGQFKIKLPHLYKQLNLGEAEFRYTLRQSVSGNIIAFLQPRDLFDTLRHWLEPTLQNGPVPVRQLPESPVQFVVDPGAVIDSSK